MDDKDVLSRCLKGDHEAFEALVDKYQANVLTFTGILMRNREEAKDITQEIFIQALENLRHFDTNKSFKNWLYSIAYRKCVDSIRRDKLFLKYLKRLAKEYHHHKDRITQKGRLEESELLGPALQCLSQKERIAVLLKINEGYSAMEIAEILQCSESTARVTLFHARKKLKKILRGDENV